MSKKCSFDPKNFPLYDFAGDDVTYVDDLAQVELIGSIVHLHFAATHSQGVGSEKQLSRRVVAKLVMPADRWEAILRQLQISPNAIDDVSTVDHHEMTAH